MELLWKGPRSCFSHTGCRIDREVKLAGSKLEIVFGTTLSLWKHLLVALHACLVLCVHTRTRPTQSLSFPLLSPIRIVASTVLLGRDLGPFLSLGPQVH